MKKQSSCSMNVYQQGDTSQDKEIMKGFSFKYDKFHQKLQKDKKGQALVEFALVLPLLLLLVLGMIEFGWLLNGKLTLNSAAREGVRIAAVLNTTEEIRKQKVYDAITKAIELSGITVDKEDVDVSDDDDYIEEVHDVVVEVDGKIKPIIGLFVRETVDLSAKARMRRE